ncbi:hypothetical protein [Pantoea sp. MQR6]|uniref:hypothetical protein n=1 Tax=Pantoea sp. MQR6 TaxID=2907307 RepID=UPI001FA9B835|nr:hypothetical protein [Pantoea sp. MQR6]
MKIACLGWGSLIWKPGQLPVEGSWYADGPEVPVEFARVSDGGEVATALCLNAGPVQVFWALLATASLDTACKALREREGIPEQRVDGAGIMLTSHTATGPLETWARSKNIDALIWTALPARTDSTEGRVPGVEEVINYLQQLEGEKRDHARRYIDQVPRQINTAYRRAIADALGWQHPDNANAAL